jgi:hypothetical protein
MTDPLMQTSARITTPDTSDDLSEPHGAHDLVIQIEGVLLQSAEVRSKPVGDGSHMRPVLCLEIAPLHKGLRRHIHAEQVYTEAGRKDAEARAAGLKRGAHVTLTTSLIDMRTVFPHIQSVVLTPTPPTAP